MRRNKPAWKMEKGVEEAVEHRLVHNMLLHAPKIELKVAGAVAVKK